MSFDPGLTQAAAAGIPVTRAPYSSGSADYGKSLSMIAEKIREGRLDPTVIGWARQALHDAGLDGRGGPAPTRTMVQAVLDAYRKQTVYTPDAAGAEVIQGAAATLCLRPGLCMRGGDCFPEGTLLLRDDYELVPVEAIRVGDRIWGRDQWTTVENTVYKGPLKVDAVETNNGSILYLTPDHKMYVGRCKHGRGSECPTCHGTERLDTLVRVPISDLREGDAVLQPARVHYGTGEMDPDRAYVEGLALADGWSPHKKGSSVRSFCIAGRDGMRKEAQKHEVKAICDRFGIETRWHRRYITVKDPEWALRIHRLGARARFKHAATIDLNEAAAVALLRGLMADSTANSQGIGRTYSTTSHRLMVQVRLLHRMAGLSTSVRMLTPEQHGGAGKHSLWRVGIRYPNPNGREEKALTVRSIDRAVKRVPCYDISTSDHYVYLPEHDVTVSNCDDGVVAVGSALLGLNIPTQVVMELYPPPAQGHVLLFCRDENGVWFSVDPSTNDAVGSNYAPAGTKRTWVDPMSNAAIEIVGIGSHGGSGVGDATGPALPIIPGVWTPVPSQVVRGGLRYAVGIVGPGDWTINDAKMYFEGDPSRAATRGLFDVETLAPGPVAGAFTGWIMVGIARVDAALANTSQVNIAGVFQETPQGGAMPTPPPQPSTGMQQTPPTPPSPGPSLGAALLVALGVAAVGGVGYGLYRRRNRRR